MGVDLYEGISDNDLNAARITSEGKTYSINHPDQLLINMRYKGDVSSSNSQGWERNSQYYFKTLQSKHPEYFSKKNNVLINSGKAPYVDKKFVDSFPQYKEYIGETLIHHHIGQDGQAVALPQSVHKGYGEIHVVEHDLGITEKAQSFSNFCKEECSKNPSLYGETSDKFLEMSKQSEQTNTQIGKGEMYNSPMPKNNQGFEKDPHLRRDDSMSQNRTSNSNNKWTESMKNVPSYSEHMKQVEARNTSNQNAFRQVSVQSTTTQKQTNAFSRSETTKQSSSCDTSNNAIKSASNGQIKNGGGSSQTVTVTHEKSAGKSK